jgi:hypothetical protein
VSGAVVLMQRAFGASLALAASGAGLVAVSADGLFASSFDGASLVVQENRPLAFMVAVQRANGPRSAMHLFKAEAAAKVPSGGEV